MELRPGLPAGDPIDLRLDIWATFATQAAFTPYYDRPVIHESSRDADKYHQLLAGTMGRAALYLPYITRRLVDSGLPPELALLPFVESAYNPHALSPGGAAGLWQFTRPTGDLLGLRRNPWYDGRKDIVRSTDAAITYIHYLNRRFDGDWLLTLAAYNSGEGRVARAIKADLARGRSADFWELELPRTTRAYITKFLAIAKLFRDGYAYQYLPVPEDTLPRSLETLILPEQISLKRAAELSGMDYDAIKRFNTGLKTEVTPPPGPHRLVLPGKAAKRFLTALAAAEKPSSALSQGHNSVSARSM